MGFQNAIKKRYRKTFGHRSPYKRTFGSRTPRQAMNVTFKQYDKALAEIKEIKERLNVEKKHKELDVSTFELGQVSGNNDGAIVQDITPAIARGTDYNERIGNSLKLTGMTFPMSFTQQTQCLGNRKVRLSLLKVRASDNGVTGQEALEQVWEVNRLIGNSVRDYNAPRRYRNAKTDGISVVRSKTFFIKGPQLDAGSQGLDTQEKNTLTTRLSVKFNDILRFDEGVSATVPNGIKYYLVFQCDAGNVASGSASTLDVPVTSVSSGLIVRLGQRNWWVDN